LGSRQQGRETSERAVVAKEGSAQHNRINKKLVIGSASEGDETVVWPVDAVPVEQAVPEKRARDIGVHIERIRFRELKARANHDATLTGILANMPECWIVFLTSTCFAPSVRCPVSFLGFAVLDELIPSRVFLLPCLRAIHDKHDNDVRARPEHLYCGWVR
jgi:hypothetical protein